MPHTPKPWTIEAHDHSDKEIIISEPGVRIDYDDVEHEVQDANARLIAASPVLLEVAKEALSWRYGDSLPHSTRERLRAAIALAEMKS